MAVSICKTCSGAGFIGRKECPDCFGFGAAAALGENFLFWGKRIDSFELILDKIRQTSRNILNGLLVLMAVFLFGYFIWQAIFIDQGAGFLKFEWWKESSLILLSFWLGALDTLYLISRLIRGSDFVKPVVRRTYVRENMLPSLNEVSFAEHAKFKRSARHDIYKAFVSESRTAVSNGYFLADEYKHANYAPLHLLYVLLQTNIAAILFGRMGISVDSVRKSTERLLAKLPVRSGGITPVDPQLYDVFFKAYFFAYENRRQRVSSLSLFVTAAREVPDFQEILYSLGVENEKLENVVAWLRINEELHEKYRQYRSAAQTRPKGGMNRSMTAVATPILNRLGEDITLKAQLGYYNAVVGREKEMSEIFRVIDGGARGVMLAGKPGVGKEALVYGLSERMAAEEVPPVLADMRMVSVSVSELVSGADPSQAQERLLTILGEIARAGNIILVIPDIAGLCGVSVGNGIDLADTLASEIGKGYFFCLATISELDYTNTVENTALGRAFEKIRIDEMKDNEAIQVLESLSAEAEYMKKIFFSYDALEKAVKLSGRYLHERFLPEKAIEIMNEAATMVRTKRGEKQIVTGEDVAIIISEKTRVPVTEVTSLEAEKLLKIEEKMHERVIGQDEAVKAVAAALRRSRAELREGKRPIANFLFLGPTGVGKTELAKTVADVYFGSENSMVRLDMSEYQDQSSIYRLIGPPGESGGGILTEAIRKQPFALLLLDELEKAHPDILNVFLQVMDDGRLTDNTGRVIDFTNIIIIATSNAGTTFIQDEVKKGAALDEIKKQLLTDVLRQNFKPEFLNRFDGIIVFKPLTADQILQITWLMIVKIQERLKVKGIYLEVDDAAAEELAAAGFDPLFGARPLRRVIQERVEDILVNFLLTRSLGRRDIVTLKSGGKLEITKAVEI